MTTYSESGVNLDLGDKVSEIIYNAAKITWANRKGKLGEVIVPFDDFTGVRAIDVSNLPGGTLMNISFDGVGTKIEIAERMEKHATIAYDLFAMVCDDAVVRGAEPVLVGSILDVKSLSDANGAEYIDDVRELADGYINAAKCANVAVVNGEVAELGTRVAGYGNFNYNWGAAVVWFAKKERMFTGREIKVGDYLVGLQEDGFRSNGLSLVRKIMEKHKGQNWHDFPWLSGTETLGDSVLTPSRIYTSAIVDMFGGYDKEPKAEIHGVAHITGGGLPGKIKRMLKSSGYGACIIEPLNPPNIMLCAQAMGRVGDEEAYRVWNMGHGMVVVTPEPDNVMKIATEHKIKSQYIGKVTKDPAICIRNKGAYSKDKKKTWLDY